MHTPHPNPSPHIFTHTYLMQADAVPLVDALRMSRSDFSARWPGYEAALSGALEARRRLSRQHDVSGIISSADSGGVDSSHRRVISPVIGVQQLSAQQHLSSLLLHARQPQQQAEHLAAQIVEGHETDLPDSVNSSKKVSINGEPCISSGKSGLHSCSTLPGSTNFALDSQCEQGRSGSGSGSSSAFISSHGENHVSSVVAAYAVNGSMVGDHRTDPMHLTTASPSGTRRLSKHRVRHNHRERESGLSVVSTGGVSGSLTKSGLRSVDIPEGTYLEQSHVALRKDNSDRRNLHSTLSAVRRHADEWIETTAGHLDGGIIGPQNGFDVIEFEDGACGGNEIAAASRSSLTTKAAASAVSK